jgi:hypothetical protein
MDRKKSRSSGWTHRYHEQVLSTRRRDSAPAAEGEAGRCGQERIGADDILPLNFGGRFGTAVLVALGLIGGVDGFHDAFFIFALVILPVALFVGLGTMLRMGSANYHDARTIIGMNRIRGAYLEIAPELAPYFVMGVHDDVDGAWITAAVPPGMPTWVHFVSATPFLVIVLNAVVAGAIAALVVVRFVASGVGAGLAGGIVVAAIVLGAQLLVGALSIRSVRGRFRPLFPTPSPDERPEA